MSIPKHSFLRSQFILRSMLRFIISAGALSVVVVVWTVAIPFYGSHMPARSKIRQLMSSHEVRQ